MLRKHLLTAAFATKVVRKFEPKSIRTSCLQSQFVTSHCLTLQRYLQAISFPVSHEYSKQSSYLKPVHCLLHLQLQPGGSVSLFRMSLAHCPLAGWGLSAAHQIDNADTCSVLPVVVLVLGVFSGTMSQTAEVVTPCLPLQIQCQICLWAWLLLAFSCGNFCLLLNSSC